MDKVDSMQELMGTLSQVDVLLKSQKEIFQVRNTEAMSAFEMLTNKLDTVEERNYSWGYVNRNFKNLESKGQGSGSSG